MQERYKIVLDCLGGDNGLNAIVLGASLALNAYPELDFTLVGPKDEIISKVKEFNIDESRIQIVDAQDVILNTDNPMTAIMQKKESTLVKSMLEVGREDENYVGMITAGSSGAILMGSFRFLSTIEKTRPCLAAVLPHSQNGYTCIVDTGATIDATSGQLHEFARLGSDFMKKLYMIESPRVGLLSNGSEATKGNHLVKETFPLLKEDPSLNFVGNIEGNNSLSGDCDVLVCDGFAGNIVLKNSEGMAKRVIKDIVVYSKKTNRPEFMEVAKYLIDQYDFTAKGGAFILGARKLIIKAHGNCDERAVVGTSGMLLNYAKGDSLFR